MINSRIFHDHSRVHDQLSRGFMINFPPKWREMAVNDHDLGPMINFRRDDLGRSS